MVMQSAVAFKNLQTMKNYSENKRRIQPSVGESSLLHFKELLNQICGIQNQTLGIFPAQAGISNGFAVNALTNLLISFY